MQVKFLSVYLLLVLLQNDIRNGRGIPGYSDDPPRK